MLEMEEVRAFADTVSARGGFPVMDESYISRIVVLQNRRRFIDRWIPAYLTT
jgi:tRNA wybutosine-synthesizing protein 1